MQLNLNSSFGSSPWIYVPNNPPFSQNNCRKKLQYGRSQVECNILDLPTQTQGPELKKEFKLTFTLVIAF